MIEKAQNQRIFMFDARGVVNPKEIGTFNRHQGYAKMLKATSPNSLLSIISASSRDFFYNPIPEFTYSEIKANSRFSFRYLEKSLKIITSSAEKPAIFIAGDPWESSISALLVRSILNFRKNKIRVPIQIQIHADITDPNWKNASLVNYLRFKVARLTLSRADQIRCVSDKSRNEVSKLFNIDKNYILVIPVELNIPNGSSGQYYSNRSHSIGFAGRIHRERGLKTFTEFASNVIKQDATVKIVIAGSGTDAQKFVSDIETITGSRNILYMGNLDQDKMANFWSKVGVFVTTAKSESYGRSMREAALLGIPVIGLESRGLNQLLELGIPWVFKMNQKEIANIPISKLNALIEMKTNNLALEKLSTESKNNLDKLINSWIRLASSNASY
jgi:glycosyltransferase involved in cell wall biosynthesis